MYVMCTHYAGEAVLYILSRYLWKHELKSLNYVSGQMLCLLTPHYTHSPLSHFYERGSENASRSFSQEWLTFRKTEKRKQMGRRGMRQRERDVLHSDKWIISLNEGLTKKKKHKSWRRWTRHDQGWTGPVGRRTNSLHLPCETVPSHTEWLHRYSFWLAFGLQLITSSRLLMALPR